ncbi:hypothetical protein OROGR_020183 [Orobanche gracilis]
MADRLLVRQLLRQWRPSAATSRFKVILTKETYEQQCFYATSINGKSCEKEKDYNQWLVLPPFTPNADGCSIGKQLHGLPSDANMTAIKWILKSCPHIPRSLVQKLFRLRQVHSSVTYVGVDCQSSKMKEVENGCVEVSHCLEWRSKGKAKALYMDLGSLF